MWLRAAVRGARRGALIFHRRSRDAADPDPDPVRILPADVRETGTDVTLAYPFESTTRPHLNGTLWFRVPAACGAWLSTGPEAAVASLLMLAMALGEPLEVEAPMSPMTHYAAGQCIDFFHLWLPATLKRVQVTAPSYASPAAADPRAVMSCFSGGVDSFHTVYDHLDGAAPNPDYALTHLFFAHGFDIPVEDATTYDAIAAEYETLAAGWNLGFVRVATNVREVLDPHVPWLTSHGTALAGCALLLGRGVRTFIIPSTNRHSRLFAPCGSNPVTDPAFGTASLQIVHYGSHRSRIEKIRDIARRAEAQEYLRVCWKNVAGVRNCGRCEKCLKVMMPLALEGVLETFTGFPPLPEWNRIDPACFAPLDLSKYEPEQSYADELRALALERGRPDVAALLGGAGSGSRRTASGGWRRLRRLFGV